MHLQAKKNEHTFECESKVVNPFSPLKIIFHILLVLWSVQFCFMGWAPTRRRSFILSMSSAGYFQIIHTFSEMKTFWADFHIALDGLSTNAVLGLHYLQQRYYYVFHISVQARILLGPEFAADHGHVQSGEHPLSLQQTVAQPPEVVPILDSQLIEEHRVMVIEECGVEPEKFRVYSGPNDIDKDSMTHDGSASCFACVRNDSEDPFQHSSSYEAKEDENDGIGPLTSCVGTRWYRAPELLYGSTTYGFEIDLWSVACIFSELLILEPIFPGSSDIDQLGKIFSILGNITEEVWPGCVQLPDYKLISFGKVDKPIGLEVSLHNRSSDEVLLVKKLLCFDPLCRATAMELLHDKYLNEEPLPVPLSDLRIPSKHGNQDLDSSAEWNDYGNFESDSDFDDFGSSTFTTTENGFSIRFS